MKKIQILALALLATGMVGFTACKKNAQTTDEAATAADGAGAENVEEATGLNAPAGTPIEAIMNGTIDPKTWTPEEDASLSIDRFPKNLNEWKDLQEQIGGEPAGCVMLQLAAFELYNRDTEAGTEAIKLNNVDSNVNSVLRIIQDKFGKTQYDDMHMPYLVATYLDGATPQNAYNPTKPYTIKVRTSPVHEYERSEMLKGYVLYLEVYSSGYDSSWRGCEVIKQKGSDYYKVNNCPSMYMGCKDIDFECDDEYHGLD